LTVPCARAILLRLLTRCFEGWRDGRVDDGDGLENRSGFRLTGGSNPSPSAVDTKRYPFNILNQAHPDPIYIMIRGGARVDDWGRLLSG
jgi:hypothetical protein